jgi:hypothetical protein
MGRVELLKTFYQKDLKMKTYRVVFCQQIEGYVDVEAENDEEAVSKAWDHLDEVITVHEDIDDVDVYEVE